MLLFMEEKHSYYNIFLSGFIVMNVFMPRFISMQAKVLMCMFTSIFSFCLVGCVSHDLSEQERVAQKKAQSELLEPDKMYDLEKARRLEVQKKRFLVTN